MIVFNGVPDGDMACSSFIAVTMCSHPSEGLSINMSGIRDGTAAMCSLRCCLSSSRVANLGRD
jgi:hypothetical protein